MQYFMVFFENINSQDNEKNTDDFKGSNLCLF